MTLQFKRVTNKVPVVIEDENGQSVEYELREMSAALRDRYLDRLAGRMKIDAQGKPSGVQKYEGLQADLVSQCLFKVGESKFVSANEIQELPSSVVSELFKEAQKLNHLSEEEKQPEKND